MIIELIWMPARALRGKGTAFIKAQVRLRSRGLSQGIPHEAPFLNWDLIGIHTHQLLFAYSGELLRKLSVCACVCVCV